MVEYALRFGFQASNNEAEYEALLAGIRLAHALKVDLLSVHSDSLLVVNYVLGDYEARDERMAQYLQLVKNLASKFKNFAIQQTTRDQNMQVDTLSRLASAKVTNVQRSIYLEFLKERNISSQIKIRVVDQEPSWMDIIIKYLSTSKLPSERHEARNLRVKAARFTSVAHPQSNGQTENMNHNILQGLKKKLDEAKGTWVDELFNVLWAYRTTPHSVRGETPFLLCYGT
ncbi:hypothetical protein RJ639_008161 [Escallonia herrerae]|uniref:RNase H type-1 domain-containing protein n=1 Tax=Escallonia herrerae TaxID=1293975 RepID=A0AA88VUI1_9ASTE|nr:hypothetical protein RJ639_008161 [Escallonia herrerae]